MPLVFLKYAHDLSYLDKIISKCTNGTQILSQDSAGIYLYTFFSANWEDFVPTYDT